MITVYPFMECIGCQKVHPLYGVRMHQPVSILGTCDHCPNNKAFRLGKYFYDAQKDRDAYEGKLPSPYIQTFFFEGTGFMAGFLHQEKTSAFIASGLMSLP